MIEVSRTTHTTPNGTPYARVLMDDKGDACLVFIPRMVVEGQAATLVIFGHGNGSSETHIEDPRMTGVQMGWLDRGWIIASHNVHGRTFGNARAMSDFRSAYESLASRYWVTRTVLYGYSMGGLAVLNAAGRREVPFIQAVVTINGTVDPAASGAVNEIKAAYGAATAADIPTATVGYNPATDPPQKWAGIPIFISASPNDQYVPLPEHAQVFYDRAAAPDLITFRPHTGAHGEGFVNSDVLAWLDTLVPAHDPAGIVYLNTPTPYRDPLSAGSGMWRTDGTLVSRYATGSGDIDWTAMIAALNDAAA